MKSRVHLIRIEIKGNEGTLSTDKGDFAVMREDLDKVANFNEEEAVVSYYPITRILQDIQSVEDRV